MKKISKVVVIGLSIIVAASLMAACGGKQKKQSAIEIQTTVPKPATVATTTTVETTVTETTAEETITEETTTEPETTEDNSNVIRDDIKAAIDSYETFVDEYCEFMSNYNASDLTLLAKYTQLLSKEVEMAKKFDAISEKDLTDAEALYYSEVSLRCSQKMMEAAYSIN